MNYLLSNGIIEVSDWAEYVTSIVILKAYPNHSLSRTHFLRLHPQRRLTSIALQVPSADSIHHLWCILSLLAPEIPPVVEPCFLWCVLASTVPGVCPVDLRCYSRYSSCTLFPVFYSARSMIKRLTNRTTHLKCKGDPDPLCPVYQYEHDKYIHNGNGLDEALIMLSRPNWLLRLDWSVSTVFSQ